MEHTPLVSIIVNCYNSEQYLKETIGSILAQTYSNYEIIFWDNQSTDTTANIIKSYNDERIYYYYADKHTTLGEARNLAMEKVKGELLAFLDSDDVWLPDFLENAVFALAKDEYSFYYSNYYNWINSKDLVLYNNNATSSPMHFGDLLSSYRVGMSAAVVKTAIIMENQIMFDDHFQMIEDYDFFLKISHIKKCYYDSTPLMKYRTHAGSLTLKNKKIWAYEFSILYKSLKEDKLNTDEIKRYSNQLKWLKIRSINALAEEYIIKRKRLLLIRLYLKNMFLSYKLMFLLIGLFLSGNDYFKLKQKLVSNTYIA